MAERRMFAKTIIDSDVFLEMPITSQCLYFHLSMRADDEGFINKPKTIMRMIGCKDDDVNILILKKFIIPFETGVVVIKHWKIHNYIRNDRVNKTKYSYEKSLLEYDDNQAYTIRQPSDGHMSDICQSSDGKTVTQVRLGKVRLGKDRLDNTIVKINFDHYVDFYNQTCVLLPKVKMLTEKRKTAIRKFASEFTFEQFQEICQKANESGFLVGNNDHKWKADFDFILRTDKSASILEGKYDTNNPSYDTAKIKSKVNNFMDELSELYAETKKEEQSGEQN